MTPQRRAAATRLAARLLFPSEGPAPDPGALDEESFVQVVVRNKVPLALVDDATLAGALPEGWRGARVLVARERDRLATATVEYTRIAHAWKDASIPAVLIKSPGYFPYTSDNVDVLVASDAAERARTVLEGLGYRELPWVREPFKILLRKVSGEPAGFAIHLHTRVAWINSFFEDAEVLGASEPFGDDDTLRRPGPESAFLITTAHWFYEDKEIKLRDLYHSREILRDDLRWSEVFAAAERGGWAAGLRSAVHLLKLAGTDLGLRSVSSRLPETAPPTSRLVPRFVTRGPVAALPARIERRKAKAMHFAKSVRNPRAGLVTRVREVTLVGAYALKVRFPALQRAPLFVVSAAGGAGLRAALRHAAETLRSRFSLPVETHETERGPSLGMTASGGIHILESGPEGGSARHGAVLRAAGDTVRLQTRGAREPQTIPLGADGELPLATAIARAYLESIG